jgi:tetratricopeptide (TPR) repeat protein
MRSFIDYAEDECAAQDYIADKYYFAHNPRWSNDVAFLFEQAGYYSEAVALLQEIVRKHPDRTVAYLNLADSYWALDHTAQAVASYEQYLQLMRKQNKPNVPKRVAARIALSQDL